MWQDTPPLNTPPMNNTQTHTTHTHTIHNTHTHTHIFYFFWGDVHNNASTQTPHHAATMQQHCVLGVLRHFFNSNAPNHLAVFPEAAWGLGEVKGPQRLGALGLLKF